MVELIRLGVTLLFTAIGYRRGLPPPGGSEDVSQLLGAIVGAGSGYVLGGALGRLLTRQVASASTALQKARPGPEMFARALGTGLGVVTSGVLTFPVFFVLDPVVAGAVYFLSAVIVGGFGGHLLGERWNEVLSVFGMRAASPFRTRSLSESPPTYLVDSSAAIDGRILEMFRMGLLEGDVWVATDVLDELQSLADSADPGTRRRGRRGLEVLHSLGGITGTTALDEPVPGVHEVDARLIELSLRSESQLITLDGALARSAELRGVRVVNPADVAASLKADVKAGETVTIHLTKEGTRQGQAVGYLDDGTMVVVEEAADRLGEELEVEVTSWTRSAVGQLLFARVGSGSDR